MLGEYSVCLFNLRFLSTDWRAIHVFRFSDQTQKTSEYIMRNIPKLVILKLAIKT